LRSETNIAHSRSAYHLLTSACSSSLPFKRTIQTNSQILKHKSNERENGIQRQIELIASAAKGESGCGSVLEKQEAVGSKQKAGSFSSSGSVSSTSYLLVALNPTRISMQRVQTSDCMTVMKQLMPGDKLDQKVA